MLKGFFGLIGYYRHFVKGYGNVAALLTKLLQKNAFKWDEEATTTFEQLKQAMVSVSVLALPNFLFPFIIETDASCSGLGAVLSQNARPIAYFSYKLHPEPKLNQYMRRN